MAVSVFDHPILERAPRPVLSPMTRWVVTAAETLAVWEMRARTRAQLREMPPERLPDIGLTTAEALIEGAKPFWRP